MIDIQDGKLTVAQCADGILQQIHVLRHVEGRLRLYGEPVHADAVRLDHEILKERWEELDEQAWRTLEGVA